MWGLNLLSHTDSIVSGAQDCLGRLSNTWEVNTSFHPRSLTSQDQSSRRSCTGRHSASPKMGRKQRVVSWSRVTRDIVTSGTNVVTQPAIPIPAFRHASRWIQRVPLLLAYPCSNSRGWLPVLPLALEVHSHCTPHRRPSTSDMPPRHCP